MEFVITGIFTSSSIIFGQGEPNQTTLSSAGSYDMYVAKYSSEGNLIWAKSAGGTSQDWGRYIVMHSDGSSTVQGFFIGSMTFGQGESNTTTLVSAGSYDIYIAKYNANGTLAWARRAGGAGQDAGRGLDIHTDGTIFFTGYFQGTANFGQGGNIRELTSRGSTDYFIARYNSNGTLD
ncbi:MAG: hypothetical protein RJB24_658 [Candidatus Parcubacteria bacterium]|jgi:hypothetical protein